MNTLRMTARRLSTTATLATSKTYRLVTVNAKPERAQRVVGMVAKRLEDRYKIEHVGNCEREDHVAATVLQLYPDILFCASSWTPEESSRILAAAQKAQPGLLTYAAPHGLHGAGGPEALAGHLAEKLSQLLEKEGSE